MGSTTHPYPQLTCLTGVRHVETGQLRWIFLPGCDFRWISGPYRASDASGTPIMSGLNGGCTIAMGYVFKLYTHLNIQPESTSLILVYANEVTVCGRHVIWPQLT